MKSESPRYFWPFAFRQGKAKERWFQVLHSKLVAEAESDSAKKHNFTLRYTKIVFCSLFFTHFKYFFTVSNANNLFNYFQLTLYI